MNTEFYIVKGAEKARRVRRVEYDNLADVEEVCTLLFDEYGYMRQTRVVMHAGGILANISVSVNTRIMKGDKALHAKAGTAYADDARFSHLFIERKGVMLCCKITK